MQRHSLGTKIHDPRLTHRRLCPNHCSCSARASIPYAVYLAGTRDVDAHEGDCRPSPDAVAGTQADVDDERAKEEQRIHKAAQYAALWHAAPL